MRSRRATHMLTVALTTLAGCADLTTPEKRTVDYQVFVVLDGPASSRDTVGAITTGDILQYRILVLSEDALFLPQSEAWTSSDTAVLKPINPDRGDFLARAVDATKLDTVRVVAFVEAEGQLVRLEGADTFRVARERFFGAFSDTTPQFLQQLRVTAPREQPFSPGTQLLFDTDRTSSDAPFVPAIVTQRLSDSVIVAVVPAGFTFLTTPAALTEIAPDGRVVVTRLRFVRDAGDSDLDLAESPQPNDTIETATSIAVPLGFAFLSIHGDKDFPLDQQDRDFFTFSLAAQRALRFSIAWNVGSNLDFEVFSFDPILGTKQVHLSATSPSSLLTEEGTVTLDPGQYFLRVYPASFIGPTTYVLTIQ